MVDAIINERAGGRGPCARQRFHQELPRCFQEAGLDDVRIHWASPPEVPALVQRVAQAGAKRLIVGGGDGTLSAAAHRLAGTGTALGVLPVGTLNHFAKTLKLPCALDEAVAALARGREMAVDVGEVNGRVFLDNVLLGAYVSVVRRREAYRRRLGLSKWPAMGIAMLRVLWRLPTMTLRLEDQDGAVTIRTSSVLLGNNAYLREGQAGVERQSLTEGKLSVISSPQRGRLGLFNLGFRLLLGHANDPRLLEQRLTGKAHIEVRKRHVRVTLDGEVIKLAAPLEFRIRPRALKVIVP